MKLLLDSCVWGPATAWLRTHGVDAIWAGDMPANPGDLQLLRAAHSERRVVVTLDKDFGELAILQGVPHSGIIRLVGLSVQAHGPAAMLAARSHADELASGAVVTVEPARTRIRPGNQSPPD